MTRNTADFNAITDRCLVLAKEYEEMWAAFDSLPRWKKPFRFWGAMSKSEKNLEERRLLLTQLSRARR